MTVGVIHVEPHNAKPVIASKTEGDVAEGAIYYRYPGETKAICYADLRAILDERDQRSREAIMPMVQRLLELGPKDAMVANLADGQLEGGHRPIIIDQQLVDRIKFIRDGEFDEREGAETLRLVGDVSAVDLSSVTTIKTVRTELTEESIVRNFAGRVLVEEPLAYPRVFNDGVVALSASGVGVSILSVETCNEQQRQSRPATGSREGPAGGSWTAGRSWSPGEAEPSGGGLLRENYLGQLGAVFTA